MDRSLVRVAQPGDVLQAYRGMPVGELLAYQNLQAAHRRYNRAELLIGMCMDHRKRLRIPPNFAYVLRTGGADLRPLEFQVSFAIAVGGVRALCLIGHNDCGMVGLASKREEFVRGLIENGGWEPRQAPVHFDEHASRFEAWGLRKRYPGIMVAPLFFAIGDENLYQIDEGDSVR